MLRNNNFMCLIGRYLKFTAITAIILLSSFDADELSLKTSIPVKAAYFTTDNLGNIYFNKGDEVLKHDANNGLQHTYSNKLLGEITGIDASNPMKIVLFYKDFSQVVFLDNMLGIQGDAVPLEQHGLEQVTSVCSSHNNGLWVYDMNTFQLIRLDQEFKVQQESGDVNQLIGAELNPNYLRERNNWVYLNDPALGILVFDVYATYYKTIPLKGLKEFQVGDGIIYYQKEKEFFGFDMKTLAEARIAVPDTVFKQVRLEKQNLFVLTDTELKIYSPN